mgnify:CR=1 FL=1
MLLLILHIVIVGVITAIKRRIAVGRVGRSGGVALGTATRTALAALAPRRLVLGGSRGSRGGVATVHLSNNSSSSSGSAGLIQRARQPGRRPARAVRRRRRGAAGSRGPALRAVSGALRLGVRGLLRRRRRLRRGLLQGRGRRGPGRGWLSGGRRL